MAITQEYLKSVLDYNPETGMFVWKYRPLEHFKSQGYCDRWNANYFDKKAGCTNNQGYYKIKINNVAYSAHRLAFLYVYGWMPPEVDHYNLNKSDNRICNLRASNALTNKHNQTKRKDNKSGYKGVVYHKRDKKYQAQIRYNNKLHHLGYFETAEAAGIAYSEAAKLLHGEFARFE